MTISRQGGPIWLQRPGLALLAGVATLAVTAGAGAGYWAGSQAGSAPPATDPSLRAELDAVAERLATLERMQSLRLADMAAAGALGGDLESDDVAGSTVPGPQALPGTPEPAAEREAGRFGGAAAARWMETFEALQNTQDPTRRRALALDLAKSPIPPLRLEALRTLLEIDSEEGLAAVRAMVADVDRNPRSQRVAAQAISLLADVSGRAVDEDLYAFTGSESGSVQRAALRTLEQRGDPAPMRAALAAQQPALNSDDAGTRARTLREIGALRTPTAAAMIIPLLRDSDSGVRIQALESLGRSGGGAPALAAVEPLLSDPVPAVRDMAVRAVQRLNRGPEDPDPRPLRFQR